MYHYVVKTPHVINGEGEGPTSSPFIIRVRVGEKTCEEKVEYCSG